MRLIASRPILETSSPKNTSVAGPPEASDTPPGSLPKLLARGSAWALVGYASSQLLRLGSNLILWRLLTPDVFGLMAIVSAVMQGLAMFSDVGIGPSIIQNERGDQPRYLNTAWTIQVVRGALLFLLAMAAAVPIAHFYSTPRLHALIVVVSLGLLVSGFNSTKLFTATRQIAIGRLTLIDLASQLLGLLVTVLVAYVRHDIWAIVWGGLAANLLKLVASHRALPGIRNRITWDRESAAVMMRFGRWVFFSTLLTFFAMQSDRLIFGKLISIDKLGVYNIANVWASIPLAVIGRVFEVALFPVLCRFGRDDADFERTFQRIRTPWLILAGWLCTCLIAGGPALIRFLYDRRAADAEWIVPILAASAWLYVLENANGTALLALGHPKFLAAGNLAKLLGMVVLIPLGMKLHGFFGAVIGYAFSEFFRYVVCSVALASLRIKIFLHDVALTSWVMATAGVGMLAAHWLRAHLAPLAVRHLRAAAFVEAALVASFVGIGWAAALLRHRVRSRRTSTSADAA